MARVYTSGHHTRPERWIYRAIGVKPDEEQRWTRYLGSLLAFSMMGVLLLYGLLLLQNHLPAPWGHHNGMDPSLAFNTAVSFTTNTSWQNYSGEAALGHFALAAGLGVAAFASAAVGMCVAVALIRGLARKQTDDLGNFWVDLIRGCVRILLPLSLLFAVVLVALGVVQNFDGAKVATTVAGGHQSLLGGPVGSWERACSSAATCPWCSCWPWQAATPGSDPASSPPARCPPTGPCSSASSPPPPSSSSAWSSSRHSPSAHSPTESTDPPSHRSEGSSL
jgi:K+-transporting ATPase ATPase A chain